MLSCPKPKSLWFQLTLWPELHFLIFLNLVASTAQCYIYFWLFIRGLFLVYFLTVSACCVWMNPIPQLLCEPQCWSTVVSKELPWGIFCICLTDVKYLEILLSYESEQSAVSGRRGAFGNCDDCRDLELTRASHKSFAAGELTVAGQHADRWVAEPLENRWDCLIGTLRLTGYKTANFQRPWCCSCALEM